MELLTFAHGHQGIGSMLFLTTVASPATFIRTSFMKKARGILGGMKWVYCILPFLIIQCNFTLLWRSKFFQIQYYFFTDKTRKKNQWSCMGKGRKGIKISKLAPRRSLGLRPKTVGFLKGTRPARQWVKG
jgi:hypothetical protein